MSFEAARQCRMTPPPTPVPTAGPLDDDDIRRLQERLDQVPAPLQPLDVSSLDGFLCGVLLQPCGVAAERWLPCITDVDGRALPPGFDAGVLHALVLRRFAQLDHAIAARQWFDPWVFELDGQTSPSQTVLPWIAGFAAAMERFPDLMRIDDRQLMEPLALLYMHFDPDDLDDADVLQAVIETLEPPVDLSEAVQDMVRALMLIADVSRPLAALPTTARGARPRAPHRHPRR
jgi:uncharacterized protein